MAAREVERFDARDMIQSAVGALAGAMIYGYQADIARLSDSMPLLNIVLIVLITVTLSVLLGYGVGVRTLGKRKMKFLFGLLPLRITVHYVFALVFSAIILWLLGINNLGTPVGSFSKRIIVLALPATLLGSTLDLVESQKG